MSTMGLRHLVFAVGSIVSGAWVLVLRKGTRRHRRVGWVYAASMLGLNGTAFMLYRLFVRFGPFHIAALVSLLAIVAGMVAAVRRRPDRRWIEHHAYWMTWSYVGLLAAAASEITTRVPASPFWWMVMGSTLMVVAVGSQLIRHRVPPLVQRFQKPRPEALPAETR